MGYPIPYRAKVKAIRQHPQHPRALLVAVAMGGMIASLDGGLTWSERHQGLSREVNDLALHPARPARVYAATGGGFFRSDDLASTWQEAHQGLPYLFTQALALDPEDQADGRISQRLTRRGFVGGPLAGWVEPGR